MEDGDTRGYFISSILVTMVKIESSWKEALSDFFETPEFAELGKAVRAEYENGKVYPAPKNIFRAFDETPFGEVKVIILGQDPYHGHGQAEGLSFSVPDGVLLPPSLKNIFKEIENDIGIDTTMRSGNLLPWAQQGVFLLNSILTVRAKQAASHHNLGWEKFTDTVIRKLSENRENLVFMLWGNYARGKKDLIDRNKHLILEASHPSPFSADNGFFGCKHFSKCNEYLKNREQNEIFW